MFDSNSTIFLSAIVITKNEANNLSRCLSSLKFCDEIIVVDANSSDSTRDIALLFSEKVFLTKDWPGFGIQKQRALDKASGKWILSVDADEVITSELQCEIKEAIHSKKFSGYFIGRSTLFLGRWMRFGGWSPDYVLRLALRERVHFDGSTLHEKMVVNGSCGKLFHVMQHYSYPSLDAALRKQAAYAVSGKKRILDSGRYTSITLALIRSIWTFIRLFFIQLGLLDGKHGFLAAALKSQEVFWKYVAAYLDKNQSASK